MNFHKGHALVVCFVVQVTSGENPSSTISVLRRVSHIQAQHGAWNFWLYPTVLFMAFPESFCTSYNSEVSLLHFY